MYSLHCPSALHQMNRATKYVACVYVEFWCTVNDECCIIKNALDNVRTCHCMVSFCSSVWRRIVISFNRWWNTLYSWVCLWCVAQDRDWSRSPQQRLSTISSTSSDTSSTSSGGAQHSPGDHAAADDNDDGEHNNIMTSTYDIRFYWYSVVS